MEEDEYELIPLSPIRRLERRMERVEKTGSSMETTRELIEIVRANQHVIDEMVSINSDMMKKLTDLLSTVSDLATKMNDFMSRLEVAAEEPPKQEENKLYDERMDKLEKKLNTLLIASLSRAKFKRPMAPIPRMQ